MQGHHQIDLDLRFVGPTCGLLPVGVASVVLTTTGLKWNLSMGIIVGSLRGVLTDWHR